MCDGEREGRGRRGHNGTVTALLAISHGTGNPAGQRAVAALVDAVAARLPGATVRLGHVDVQQPDVPTSLAGLEDQPVTLVPLLLSAGYHVHVDLRRATAHRTDVTITPALGPDERLVEVLTQRLAEAGWDATATSPVVLAVAGSSDERANQDCREIARRLSARLARAVSIGFLAAAEPRLRTAVAEARETQHPAPPHADPTPPPPAPTRVFVATYLLAPGYFHDLAVREASGAVVARPLLDDDAPAEPLISLVLERYTAAR